MQMSVCGHFASQQSIFSEVQVFKTTDISSCQTAAESALLFVNGEQVLFICIDAKYVNHTKQNLKGMLLELHLCNSIISIHIQ